MKQNMCPLCGCDKTEKLFSHARIVNIRRTFASREAKKKYFVQARTDICMQCGMVFRKPLMSEEESREYYNEKYYHLFKQQPDSSAKPKNPLSEEEIAYFRNKYQKYFTFLDIHGVGLKGKNILDIGSGYGRFCYLLKEKGAKECVAIEPSQECYEVLCNNKRLNFKLLHDSFLNLVPTIDKKFDMVTLIGVFEHMSDPVENLSAARALLNEEGLIYIYTGNENPSLFLDIKKRISTVHQLYFTKRTITLLCEKVGLQVVAMRCVREQLHVLAKRAAPEMVELRLHWLLLCVLKLKYRLNHITPSWFFTITHIVHVYMEAVIKKIIRIGRVKRNKKVNAYA